MGKKGKTEFGLCDLVVLNLCEKLESSYWTLYFDNLFNGPMLANKLYDSPKRQAQYGYYAKWQRNKTRWH